ncbi:MAG: nucleotide-binding protein [Acidobacteriota bacterium]
MAPTAQDSLLKGEVLERIDAMRYSYLRLATDEGEIWAAVLQTDVEPGEEVTVVNPMLMNGFESETLNRTFDRIVFGTLQESGGSPEPLLMDAHSGVAGSTASEPIEVDKAEGPVGRTVEEIYAQKLDLNGQKVAVRGKVTKVNPNILHIQDGTGDPQAGTNDLTVTSQENPSVGDTVLIEGIIGVDKSSGMGYDFPVIIEDATVKKQ